ncbi:hypothetical protein JZ751_025101 [Albula glossodonta]|uniref:Uncharacterized protein n=1 Tax=Albula glossodonta TaxID=121402 RepID=A0A8T2PGF2_9TELE|nr:hypothetical protein JZ751_025101 [Albula glossodonta]
MFWRLAVNEEIAAQFLPSMVCRYLCDGESPLSQLYSRLQNISQCELCAWDSHIKRMEGLRTMGLAETPTVQQGQGQSSGSPTTAGMEGRRGGRTVRGSKMAGREGGRVDSGRQREEERVKEWGISRNGKRGTER